MSIIDYEIGVFYDKMICLRWDIEDYEKWMVDYESKRTNYPAWETKEGQHIWVYEIDDSHLENLIPFMERQDPENKTHWIDVFRAEKKYRRLKKEIPSMKDELLEMEMVAEECL